MKTMKCIRLLVISILLAQTKLDAQQEILGSRIIHGDLTVNGAVTFPASRGTTVPVTCTVGQLFFRTQTQIGLHECRTTDVWTYIGQIATTTPGADAIPKAGGGGRLAIGWVASGTPDGTKFVRDDGVLAVPPGGGSSITRTAVGFSATPTFTRSSAIQQWTMTLTGDVTSSTLASAAAGDMLSFELTQDSTPRAVTLPAGFPTLPLCSTAGSVTVARYVWTGSAAVEQSVNSPGCTERIIRWSDGTTTTFPAGSDTAATLAGTQTFTNKSISASQINSGTMATARLGSGTASGSTFLRGDSTWATPAGGGGSGFHVAATSGSSLSASGTFSTTVTIPGGTITTAGAVITVRALGEWDSTSSLRAYMQTNIGTSTPSAVLCNSGANVPTANNANDLGFVLTCTVTVRTVGASGTRIGKQFDVIQLVNGSVGSVAAGIADVQATINTTVDQVIGVVLTISSGTGTVNLEQLIVTVTQ